MATQQTILKVTSIKVENNILSITSEGANTTNYDLSQYSKLDISLAVKKESSAQEDITVSFRIVNNSNSSITLNGQLRLVLTDSITDRITFNSGQVSLGSGASRTFDGIFIEGLGGESPINPSLLPQGGYDTNVVLYDENGDSGVIVPQNLSNSIVFTDGSVYTITIPSDSPGPGPSPTTSGTMTLTIVNDTGSALTVDSNGFFYVHDPELPQEMHSGVYLYLSNPRANITIPSGSSTWNNVAFEGNSSDPIVGYELNNGGSESPKLYKSISEHVNIIDAGWASSIAISGESGVLVDEGSYTLTIT